MHHLLFPLFCQPHTPQLFLFSPKLGQKGVHLTEPVHIPFLFHTAEAWNCLERRRQASQYTFIFVPNRSHCAKSIPLHSARIKLRNDARKKWVYCNSISARGDLLKMLLVERAIECESRFGATPGNNRKGCRHIDWKIYGIELPVRHK